MSIRFLVSKETVVTRYCVGGRGFIKRVEKVELIKTKSFMLIRSTGFTLV